MTENIIERKTMKLTIISLAAGLALVGCSRQDQAMNESAGAQKDQIEQSKDAAKDELKQQEKLVESQAEAQKDSIESQAEAEKAQLEARQKQLEADAEAEKAQVEASKEIQEAAGAPAREQNSDSAIETRVRAAIYGSPDATQVTSTTAKDVKISVKNGVVTLKGNVDSEATKADCEAKAKSVSGVTSVDNKLEIKAE